MLVSTERLGGSPRVGVGEACLPLLLFSIFLGAIFLGGIGVTAQALPSTPVLQRRRICCLLASRPWASVL